MACNWISETNYVTIKRTIIRIIRFMNSLPCPILSDGDDPLENGYRILDMSYHSMVNLYFG